MHMDVLFLQLVHRLIRGWLLKDASMAYQPVAEPEEDMDEEDA